jgi:hypothetical protein
MNIVAILNRSAGFDSVGEEWLETKTFDSNTPILEIMKWAYARTCNLSDPKHLENNKCYDIKHFRGNLRITINQEGE